MKNIFSLLLILTAMTVSGQNFFWSYGGGAPIVTTTAVTSITYTTATSGGNVVKGGTSAVTARGVCWSTTVNPTVANSKTTNGTGLGSYVSSISGLSMGTTYYIRAYATNGIATTYGDNVSFTTISATAPSVITADVTIVRRTTAVSGGTVTSEGSSSVTQRGVCWSLTNPPSEGTAWQTTNGSGSGSFTSSLTGLSDNTTYYLRAYAKSSAGTGYGTIKTFTTDPNPCTSSIGANYGGGKIIYFLQPGDAGYDAGVCHGLVMSENLGTAIYGCSGTDGGSSATAIGTGQANTSQIVSRCAMIGIAARICDDLVLNGYSDWYLPSLYEAQKMWDVLYATESGNYYWTSSQNNDWVNAWFIVNGFGNINSKNTYYYVRAIRSF